MGNPHSRTQNHFISFRTHHKKEKAKSTTHKLCFLFSFFPITCLHNNKRSRNMFSNSILSVLLGYFITSSVGIEAFLIAPTRNIISTNRNTSGANGKTRPISGMEFVTSPFLSNQQSRFHRLFSTQSEEEYDISEGSESKAKISNLEKAWRHVKKPLLRIGSKGASKSHGNR